DDRGALQTIRNDIRGIQFEYHDEHGLMSVAPEGLGGDDAEESRDARARRYGFDAKGRVKKVTGPTGESEAYVPTIDAVAHTVKVTAPTGIENIYDLNRGAGSVSEGRFFSDGDSVSYGAVDRSGWQEYTLPGGQQIESSTAISNI